MEQRSFAHALQISQWLGELLSALSFLSGALGSQLLVPLLQSFWPGEDVGQEGRGLGKGGDGEPWRFILTAVLLP